MSDEAASDVRLFISHHSSTYDTALQVEEQLARRGVTCWIAPRDVEPGEPFDKAISNAILGSAAILLLFCEKSDKSRHVKRELILADTAARPIIPLRLEAINPGELAYHLADSQWIDWIDRRDAVMDRVANQARQYASVTAAIDSPPPPTHRMSAEQVGAKGPSWLKIGGVIAGLVALVALTWMLASRGRDDDGPTAVATAEVAEGGTGMAAVEPSATPTVDPASEPPAATPSPTSTPTARPTNLAPRPIATPTPMVTATLAPRPLQTAAAAPVQRVVDACRGAATDAEYLICSDPMLQIRAEGIGNLFRLSQEALADDEEALRRLNAEQRRWFNSVKAQCRTYDCVFEAQMFRYHAFNNCPNGLCDSPPQ